MRKSAQISRHLTCVAGESAQAPWEKKVPGQQLWPVAPVAVLPPRPMPPGRRGRTRSPDQRVPTQCWAHPSPRRALDRAHSERDLRGSAHQRRGGESQALDEPLCGGGQGRVTGRERGGLPGLVATFRILTAVVVALGMLAKLADMARNRKAPCCL